MIQTGRRDFSSEDIEAHVTIGDAKRSAVDVVLSAPTDTLDGRSEWVWIRFPNGDLFLACAPQGDTYFSLAEEIDEEATAWKDHVYWPTWSEMQAWLHNAIQTSTADPYDLGLVRDWPNLGTSETPRDYFGDDLKEWPSWASYRMTSM